jgi:ParB family chromosome partitioning protein
MRECGLLSPITIYARDVLRAGIMVPGFGLIAGLHRLEAAKQLGWSEIDAHVVTLPDLQRQLAECDENLCGTKLTPAERALFTRRRKDIYEALHPETRNGTNQHNRDRKLCEPSAERFTADTASKTGRSERAIQLDAARGELSEQVLAEVRGTDLDRGVHLDRMARAPDPLAEARRIRAEREAEEARKANREADKVIEELSIAALADWLCARLDVTEAQYLGEQLRGRLPALSKALLREAA